MLSHVGRAALCDIAEELRCHILSFLPFNDIICCALTCQMIYNTVKSSVQLQYLIELGAQGLIPVHPRPPTLSEGDSLRIIRDNGSAWSTFKLNVTKRLCIKPWLPHKSITHQQLNLSTKFHTAYFYLKDFSEDDGSFMSKVINFRTCTPEIASSPPLTWSEDSLNSLAGTPLCMIRCVDEMQDLMVTVNESSYSDGVKYQVNFRTISTGEEHPLAHGSRLVTHGSHNSNCDADLESTAVTVLGDRLALYGIANEGRNPHWSLHVWNWQQDVQADDVCVFGDGFDSGFHDVRFLTKEKLLALTRDGHIELYDIEDLSEAPQLKARFMLPVVYPERFRYPSVFHSASACARLNAPDDNWIWTTNPADRVISVMTSPVTNLVISARIFFMDIPPTWFDVTSSNGRSVLWSSWGPQNSRHFPRGVLAFGIGGSRVIWAAPISSSSLNNPLFQLHMADFNPSAVARGIGKVVLEPTPFDSRHPEYMRNDKQVITYLPFVEVVNYRIFNSAVHDILLHEKSVLIFTTEPGTEYTQTDIEIFDM